jgi:hypothetical protein
MVCIKLKDGTRLIADNDGKVLHFTEDGLINSKQLECNPDISITSILNGEFGIFHDFIVLHYGDIDKVYTELDHWETKKYFNFDEFEDLINKVFHINKDSIPAYQSIKQFSIYLKMLKDTKSFNMTCIDNNVILLFFKPSDIVFKWYIENDENHSVLCNKEIDNDQLEMILCILKKEIQSL